MYQLLCFLVNTSVSEKWIKIFFVIFEKIMKFFLKKFVFS